MGFRERLELRRSNAAQRHRNRYREAKAGQDRHWLNELEAELDGLEPGELPRWIDQIHDHVGEETHG